MISIKLEKYHSDLKIVDEAGQRKIFDPVRKKYVLVQPEELVRQSWIAMLKDEYGIPPSVLSVEKTVVLNGISRRFDLVCYNKGKTYVLFEFKSFNIPIDSKAAFQAAQYNLGLSVPYIIISNGLEHHAFHIDYKKSISTAVDTLEFLHF